MTGMTRCICIHCWEVGFSIRQGIWLLELLLWLSIVLIPIGLGVLTIEASETASATLMGLAIVLVSPICFILALIYSLWRAGHRVCAHCSGPVIGCASPRGRWILKDIVSDCDSEAHRLARLEGLYGTNAAKLAELVPVGSEGQDAAKR